MKLGLCTSFDNLELAAKIGFEYVECAFSALANMPEEDYQKLLAKKDSFPIPVTKANLFLPGALKPVGPDVSEKALREYMERAFARANAIGIKLVVFGSGGARAVPEGWSYARAWRQLADFLEVVAEYAQKYDVVVINFLNERHAADKRVYELLAHKFQLFDGIFGTKPWLMVVFLFFGGAEGILNVYRLSQK